MMNQLSQNDRTHRVLVKPLIPAFCNTPTVIAAVVGILCAAPDLVLAVGNDSLSAGVTAAETILTGSMMRLIVIAGSIFGVIKAYMASSPLLMGGSIAIGVGINLLMTWVRATWPMVL